MGSMVISACHWRKMVTMGVAATALTASISVVSAQQGAVRNTDPEFGPYGGTYNSPAVEASPSREDRSHFDRSGTRGRMGLGAKPDNPEGAGDVSD